MKEIKCPKCGVPAKVFDPFAVVGFERRREVVYLCETCTTPGYDGFNDRVIYKTFTFLENGKEVL